MTLKNRKLLEKDTYSFKNASLIPTILVINIIMDFSREVPTKISLRYLILTKWLALKKMIYRGYVHYKKL